MVEKDIEDVDTEDVDVLEAILEEVRKVRREQERQGEKIDEIEGTLDGMRTDLEVVRQTQESHGLALAEMQKQCGRRFETCSQAMRKLRERQVGDGTERGSWPAEVGGE